MFYLLCEFHFSPFLLTFNVNPYQHYQECSKCLNLLVGSMVVLLMHDNHKLDPKNIFTYTKKHIFSMDILALGTFSS